MNLVGRDKAGGCTSSVQAIVRSSFGTGAPCTTLGYLGRHMQNATQEFDAAGDTSRQECCGSPDRLVPAVGDEDSLQTHVLAQRPAGGGEELSPQRALKEVRRKRRPIRRLGRQPRRQKLEEGLITIQVPQALSK
jgi:hypothetical protein